MENFDFSFDEDGNPSLGFVAAPEAAEQIRAPSPNRPSRHTTNTSRPVLLTMPAAAIIRHPSPLRQETAAAIQLPQLFATGPLVRRTTIVSADRAEHTWRPGRERHSRCPSNRPSQGIRLGGRLRTLSHSSQCRWNQSAAAWASSAGEPSAAARRRPSG
jgi:hypothetical protein